MTSHLNPDAAALLSECKKYSKILRERDGGDYGMACKQGLFSLTVSRKVGKKWQTSHLTPMQSYGECIAEMRRLAA